MNEIDQAPSLFSKSVQKRASEALKGLGEQLTECNRATLEKCDLPPALLAALEEFSRLPNRHGARRRQLQFIGKHMRELDEAALARIHAQLNRNVDLEKKRFHELETRRDRLLDGVGNELDELIAMHPQVNVQQLRQLIRSARKERDEQLAPTSGRKLFRLLRTLEEGAEPLAQDGADARDGAEPAED